MPALVMSIGLIFNSVNAFLNGSYLFWYSEGYEVVWLADSRFFGGLVLYGIGFVINRRADTILNKLRRIFRTISPEQRP